MTQNATILRYLQQGKAISPLKAAGVFKITRLASRIHDLKREGHPIVRTIQRDEAGQRYAEYRLEMPAASTVTSAQLQAWRL